MQERVARPVVAGIGVGTLAFGAVPLLAPRLFARLCGFAPPDLSTVSMIQSLGVRDAVVGSGLWWAATHGGNYVPWLLARALIDSGDALAVGLAVARGARHPRFVALGALALAAALTETTLYASSRRAWRREEP